MSSKPFRRKDLKHDQFITGTGRVTHWLMERRRRIGWGLLAVALVVSVVFSVRFAHQRQEQQAAALLAGAMEIYRAPVVAPAPELPDPLAAIPALDPTEATDGASDPATPPTSETSQTAAESTAEPAAEATADGSPDAAGEPVAEPAAAAPAVPAPVAIGLQFETADEKYRAALERFAPIIERYGDRPSGRVAAYYAGICQAELGDSEAAILSLTQATEASGSLISSMALYRLGQLQLDVGNADAAVGYFEQLVDMEDGLFPREEALMAKARAHREAGDPRAALATYQRVVQDFPNSYSVNEARSHVGEISAQLGVDPDIQG